MSFKGFTGYGSAKPVNQPAAKPRKTYSSGPFNQDPGLSSGQLGFTPAKKDRPAGTSSPGSGYTPGGDSYTNYSPKDQQTMFNQAGGKKAFQNQVANIEQGFGRSADVQNYLNRARQFQNAQLLGARPSNVGGIERLNFTTPGMPVMRDAQGNQILSMMRPELTAQAPTTSQFFGDMAGGVSNLLGAAGEFITGGGMLGNIIDAVKQKFSQGKDFVQSAFNPGDINNRVNNLPEAQRRDYFMYLNQGMPYQRAFTLATGQNFAMGGIASLN